MMYFIFIRMPLYLYMLAIVFLVCFYIYSYAFFCKKILKKHKYTKYIYLLHINYTNRWNLSWHLQKIVL